MQGQHIKRSSIQRHLNAFDIKQAELDPRWLVMLETSMIPLSGKPPKIVDPPPQVREERKKVVSGFVFAKFAATYFQGKFNAAYSPVTPVS